MTGKRLGDEGKRREGENPAESALLTQSGVSATIEHAQTETNCPCSSRRRRAAHRSDLFTPNSSLN